MWKSNIQCSTKVLARLFSELDFDVSYLHNPLDPAHLFLGRMNYFRMWKNSPQIMGRLHAVTPFSPIPTRDIWPLNTLTAAQFKYQFCMPSLSRMIEGDNRNAPDLIWTTVPGSAKALRRSFPKAKLVFHVIDYYPAFRGEAVKQLEIDDYAVSDEIYVIGNVLKQYLVDELNVSSAKITFLGQGVELERYVKDLPEPNDIAELAHPRMIWSGVLGKGDPELFERSANELQKHNGSLILIGPGAEWADALAQQYPDTVHLLGSCSPEDLPAYLCHSDIGAMLYDQNKQDVYRGQNPLKLYEYAAAGLPIISTPHDEFDTLKPPVEVVRTPDDISDALAHILSNLPDYSAIALRFAQNNSWRDKIMDLQERFFPEWLNEGSAL